MVKWCELNGVVLRLIGDVIGNWLMSMLLVVSVWRMLMWCISECGWWCGG